MDKNLGLKIKKVLTVYFKTQFLLIIVSLLLVWGIITIIPDLHPVYETLIVIGSYIVLSQIMDYFVSPLIVGKTVKINPLLIIISFILGISFLGIIGAFLAVPIALIIKTVWEHNNEKV